MVALWPDPPYAIAMNETRPETRADAEALDRDDPLADRRALFALPEGVIYLVGHSLGAPAKAALQRVSTAAGEDWARGLVGSWNAAGWIDWPKTVGGRIAPLIGAREDDVVVCDSVSVNLFKLAGAALPRAMARSIAVEEDEFPTDQYIAEGLARTVGTLVRKLPAGAGRAGLSEGGVLIKSAVNYRTAAVADIKAYEDAAYAHGGVIVWDLSHAAGVLPLALRDAGACFAAGCTYKYLGGGPGAPAFVYVRDDVAREATNPIPGWLGHRSPFAFSPDYQPAAGVERFVSGTPPILSLAALDGAIDAFAGIDLTVAAHKARALGELALARGASMGLVPASPPPGDRGGHVSLRHEDGYAIVQALAAEGVLADFRAPDTIRFGFAPLTLRFVDVWDAMDRLEAVLRERRWDRPEFRVRSKVT